LETLSRAKSFVDSTVLRSLTETWEKEKDPIVRRVLELALKE
jgi:hypothetical protein